MIKEGVLNLFNISVSNLQITYLLLGFFGIWLLCLSFFLFNAVNHYRKLAKGSNGQNLIQILEKIVLTQSAHQKELVQITNEIKNLENSQKKSIQKYTLMRFNPFEDTGGDQSFVATLLDGEDSGIVISSLHSRGGTRVYAKPVSSGKATSYQFSKEEKEVVEKAARHV